MAGEYPQAIEELAKSLARLPSIGKRSAERLAMALLDWDERELHELGVQLAELHNRVHICAECGNLADDEICRICASSHRCPEVICVVENARQIPVIEKCGRYDGLYHVLGGKLSPLDGVEVEDLNVETLYDRIEANEVEEVILATSPDVEGEATAGFLAEELRNRFEIKLSRIALGVPVGSDLTFADSATMAMAIDSRRNM